ncbi:MAG: hypothetical protein OEX98_06220 [Nitrosopumilus sp.]|nr:hypothetical protein [Nitrosopumilus sp.]
MKNKNIESVHTAKMATGNGCSTCNSEHDGDFYRFCKCSCHDRIAREIVG